MHIPPFISLSCIPEGDMLGKYVDDVKVRCCEQTIATQTQITCKMLHLLEVQVRPTAAAGWWVVGSKLARSEDKLPMKCWTIRDGMILLPTALCHPLKAFWAQELQTAHLLHCCAQTWQLTGYVCLGNLSWGSYMLVLYIHFFWYLYILFHTDGKNILC